MTFNIDTGSITIGPITIIIVCLIIVGGIISIFEVVYQVDKTDFQACIDSCPFAEITSGKLSCKDLCRESITNCLSSKQRNND